MLFRETGLPLERLVAAHNDFEFVTRDLLVWLLRSHCRLASGATGRLLQISEYGVGLALRRYNGSIECGSESRAHRTWREKIARSLPAER